MKIIKLLFFYWLLIILTSCASRPILAPDQKFIQEGAGNASNDIDLCIDFVEQYIQSHGSKSLVAKELGKFGRTGALALAQGKCDINSNQSQAAQITRKKYIEQCLNKKGYKVIDWD